MSVDIYCEGIVSMSVCVPKEMKEKEILRQVEVKNPSGTENGWMLSDDKTFSSGESIPCQCKDNPKRQHWLIIC